MEWSSNGSKRKRTKEKTLYSKKSQRNPATLLTKSPSGNVLPQDVNDLPKGTVIETPIACVGVLAIPIQTSSPNGVCLRRQENCSMGADACGKTFPIEIEQEDLLGYYRTAFGRLKTLNNFGNE